MPSPFSTPRRRLGLFALAVLSAATVVRAQEQTVVDALGNTVIQSIETNALGVPIDTLILETLTPAVADPAAETSDVEDPAATATTPTEIATTPTETATTEEEADTTQGNVLQPAATCTTEGCPPRPTTYTYNGVITTWYATTPETPIPTWTSSGQILNVASYITTTASGAGSGSGGGGRAPGNGASSRFSSFGFGTAGDWGIMAGVAVVGGLVGAVAVL
ncbi:hypothetical protein JCM11251_001480 [Rhodosporidiobolus azoricus]